MHNLLYGNCVRESFQRVESLRASAVAPYRIMPRTNYAPLFADSQSFSQLQRNTSYRMGMLAADAVRNAQWRSSQNTINPRNYYSLPPLPLPPLDVPSLDE